MKTTATGLPNTFFLYGRNNIVHLNQTSSWFTKVFQGCETFINNSNLINIGYTPHINQNLTMQKYTKHNFYQQPTYFWYLKSIPNSCRVGTTWGQIPPPLLLILDMDELAGCIKQSTVCMHVIHFIWLYDQMNKIKFKWIYSKQGTKMILFEDFDWNPARYAADIFLGPNKRNKTWTIIRIIQRCNSQVNTIILICHHHKNLYTFITKSYKS